MRFPPRLILPVIVVVLIAAIWVSGVTDLLSWSGLARQQAMLRAWVEAHPFLAPCLFMAIYIVSVTLSLPQAGLLTFAGGMLFGTVAGGALAVASATIGAVFLFLIARSAFAGWLAKRGGATLGRLREELQRDGFSYLLAMRLVPLFPFWLVNLAAALCGMRLRQFVAATVIGIIPTTFVTAWVGSGFSQVLANGKPPGLGVLVSWPVLGPLLTLAMLSVTPIIWRKWRARDA